LAILGIVRRLISSNIRLMVRARVRGVRATYIFGTSLKTNEICNVIYRDFLPAALAEGRYTAAPEPLIVGDGLEHIQHALEVQRAGVSARKVVVTLPTRA